MAAKPSYLIIGAGNFGASAALSLTVRSATGKVTLIDSAPFPNPKAASHDINKIVRDDYPDSMYMSMMIEGMAKWRSDPLYSQFYHQVGVLRIDSSPFCAGSLEMYKKLGVDTDAGWISVTEAKERWAGVAATTSFGGIEKVFWNPRGGWAAAEQALAKVIETAISQGVEYKANSVAKLLLDSCGSCIGAQLQDGSEVHADKILVAAGGGTAPLLYYTDPSNQKLHAGDRAVATGALAFYGRWDDERRKKFKAVPVIKNAMPGNNKGEAMSLLPSGIVKFNCDGGYTNFQPQADSTLLSVVPNEAERVTWAKNYPKALRDVAQKTMEGLYGDNAKGVEIEAYRLCWDASTPTHDFLITPHPHSRNLYIATGGSFHGWKFLPVIGAYIVKMMDGTLDEERAQRWAWDMPEEMKKKMANPTYATLGDLADLLDK